MLKLSKSLYGLHQAPQTFFEKLKASLEERGYVASEIDPCLFMKPGIICVVYVNDTIFAAANSADLDKEIVALGISTNEQHHVFQLHGEGEFGAFLGIQIEKTSASIFLLTQTGLIHKVLQATGIAECNGCTTPATLEPLNTDKHGAPFDEPWQYDSIIGMHMYLASNSCPDIAYAVHQAAQFTHCPRHSHANGVNRIPPYLQQTKRNGLFLKPQADYSVDCYVDAGFGGLMTWKINKTLYQSNPEQDMLSCIGEVCLCGSQNYKLKLL